MDLLFFTGSLCVGTLVGLTLKKHGVYLVPQTLGVTMSNREYFDKEQRDMQLKELEHNYAMKNSTRHLGSDKR
jgi:hypothetical protein